MTQLPTLPTNALTVRDRALLHWLAAVKLAAEGQIQRYFWPDSTLQAARRRLRQLEQYGLLTQVALPEKTLKTDYLPDGPGYCISPAGRLWLHQVAGVHPGYKTKPLQYHHELLLAEVSTRFFEMAHQRGWQAEWHGETAIAYAPDPDNPPQLLPDGLSIIRDAGGAALHAFFVEVDASRESHGKRRSQIGQKVTEYDAMYRRRLTQPLLSQLPHFPAVMFLTGGELRLQNLAADIQAHRREPVGYALTRLDSLLSAATPPLETPAWFLLPADHQPPLGDSPLARESLHNQEWQASLSTARLRPQPARPTTTGQPVAPPAAPATPSPPPARSAALAMTPAPKPAPAPVAIPVTIPPPPVLADDDLPLFPFGWLAEWRQWFPWVIIALLGLGIVQGKIERPNLTNLWPTPTITPIPTPTVDYFPGAWDLTRSRK